MIRFAVILLVLLVGSEAHALAVQSSDKKTPQQDVKPVETTDTKNTSIDWGEWDTKPSTDKQYGVGIEGKVERLINQLDKSDLVTNADGVTTQKRDQSKQESKPKDIAEMMAELRAMEKKLKKEVEDDTEF